MTSSFYKTVDVRLRSKKNDCTIINYIFKKLYLIFSVLIIFKLSLVKFHAFCSSQLSLHTPTETTSLCLQLAIASLPVQIPRLTVNNTEVNVIVSLDTGVDVVSIA